MSSDVHYHTQPHTLDPNQEPPENVESVPKGQAHDDRMAEDVRDAQAEHRDQVLAEREARDEALAEGEPEPGAPRAAGDHAGSDEGSDQTEGDGPPSGTIEDVKSWVGDDPDRAQQALDAERDGQNRATLVGYLEDKGAS